MHLVNDIRKEIVASYILLHSKSRVAKNREIIITNKIYNICMLHVHSLAALVALHFLLDSTAVSLFNRDTAMLSTFYP